MANILHDVYANVGLPGTYNGQAGWTAQHAQ